MKKCFSFIGRILLAMLIPWTSKRLWMGIIGLIVINAKFWCIVYYLYSFTTEPQMGYFFKLATFAMGIDATIVMWFIGLQSFKQGDLSLNLIDRLIPK
jgi:hypothetical protein